MLSRLNNIQKNFIVFFIVGNSVLLGLAFSQINGAAAIFYPAAGMSVAFYYIFRKKVVWAIIAGLYLADIIYRLAAIDEPYWQSLTLSSTFLIGSILEMFIFIYLIDKLDYKVEKALDMIDSGKYIFAVAVAASVGAFIGVLGLVIHFDGVDYLNAFLYWLIGDATGIIVFGALLMNHNYYDGELSRKKYQTLKAIFYIVIFAMFVFFVFADYGNNFMSFGTFQIFIVLLYIVAAFQFSFGFIAFNNVVFLLGVNFFYFPGLAEGVFFYEAVELSLFLIIISSTSSVIRTVFLERQSNYDQMRIAKDSLEKIIQSNSELANINTSIPEQVNTFNKEYLKNMFEIACEIYPNFDKASCNTINGEYVEFVAVKGYEKEHLNGMNFLSSEFEWGYSEPQIVETTDYDKVFNEEGKENEFISKYGVIKQSIRFTVNIGENSYAGMSFDIYKGSKYKFTRKDLYNYKSFQNLMNNYYKIGILNTEKENLKDDIVLSLVRTLELYDLYTGGHSEQVAHLCVEYARIEKLSDDELQKLYWAGIVHDIGKIGLPMEVLNLQRKLSDEEFELIKQHPINGYRILSRSKSLSHIADVVLHHHEWFNGKGYPNGLKGEDIPYHSRILHVCDAIDSMAKDRIYRKALTQEMIIDELKKGKGTQFDPYIAEIMIQFVKSGKLYKII